MQIAFLFMQQTQTNAGHIRALSNQLLKGFVAPRHFNTLLT